MHGCRDEICRRGMQCRFRHAGSLLSGGTRAALIMIGSVRIRLPPGRFLTDSGSKALFGILAEQAETGKRRERKKMRRSEEQKSRLRNSKKVEGGRVGNEKKLRSWEVEKMRSRKDEGERMEMEMKDKNDRRLSKPCGGRRMLGARQTYLVGSALRSGAGVYCARSTAENA